mgnify:CR=1 FL=1
MAEDKTKKEEAEEAPTVDIIAGDPDAAIPDAITIGKDGYCRAPDFSGSGYAEEDVLGAIRAGFKTVNAAIKAAGRSASAADRIAMQTLGQINMALAQVQLTGRDSDQTAAEVWMAILENDDTVAMASMPRKAAKQKKDG